MARQTGRGRYGLAVAFLAPALVLLGALVVWPIVSTFQRSFFDEIGTEFVGLENYEELLSNSQLRTAITNTFIWVLLFPVFTTTVGLVLAVLSDRIRAKRAFRIMLFMPAALALLSSGIIWRLVYDASPEQGLANAVLSVPAAILEPEGPLAGAAPSMDSSTLAESGSLVTTVETSANGSAIVSIGLVRVLESDLPLGSQQAAKPEEQNESIVGVLWRDTRAGENTPGEVEEGELGIPGIALELRTADGDSVVATTTSDVDGRFQFPDEVPPGTYQVVVPDRVLQESWPGVTWLGADLITVSAVVAGVWVWGGFALLVIASGLAALPEEVFEAARIDGANELQIFLYVTTPLLRPVLSVVFVALTINALKMFDLIIGIAPGSVQDEASTVALVMWRTSFTGVGNRGLGSAIAVFLFALAVPVMAVNIRRFRLEDPA